LTQAWFRRYEGLVAFVKEGHDHAFSGLLRGPQLAGAKFDKIMGSTTKDKVMA